MGMDPELARSAMEKIRTKKADLDTESKAASSALRDKVNSAFAGSQTASMQGFIDGINAALEKLYQYLDCNESSTKNCCSFLNGSPYINWNGNRVRVSSIV